MPRYIDADLIDFDGVTDTICAAQAYEAVDGIPTADVRENVHANWVGIDDFPHETFECNHCGHIEEVQDVRFLSNFCPNSGADMRERRENGNQKV